jgi:hypothetical protein
MTYQEAAQAALDCQDACNSSGILMTFTDAMLAICEEAHRRGEGTRWKNTHPIAILFLLKLSELAGCGSTLDQTYVPAEAECKQIVGNVI